LTLRQQIWDDKSLSEEILRTARSFELSQDAISYLKKLFNMIKPKGAHVLD